MASRVIQPPPSAGTHAALPDVTANQHHAEVHAIDGGDHTGSLGHGALSGVGINDHHNRDHASRHAPAGADPLTYTQLTVDGLVLDVANLDVHLRRSLAKVLTIDSDGGGALLTRIELGGGVRIIRGSVQALAAATAIVLGSSLVAVTTTGAVVTTAAPTIPNGADGQILIIRYAGGGSWQIQDQGTLANSNVRLSTATYTMNDRDTLSLIFDGADWLETARSANI